MKRKALKLLLKQSVCVLLGATILQAYIPFAEKTANASIGDIYQKGALKYSNDLDNTNGLVQIAFGGSTHNTSFSTDTIDGRTVLKMNAGATPLNDDNLFVIDSNSTAAPKNAIVEYDMKIVPASNNSNKAGYVFGVNYAATNVEPSSYTWLASQDAGTLRVRSRPPGTSASDFTTSLGGKVKTNNWQKWRIEYNNENFRVYVDDQLVTDSNFSNSKTTHSGLIGFMLWSQSTNYIDNLKVYDLVINNPPVPDDNAPSDSYELENGNVKVVMDKTFPQALQYQLKSTGGLLYGGYPNADHVAFITDSVNPIGKSYPASVSSFTPGDQKVTYTLNVPDFHGGLDIAYEFSLSGNELVKKITSISGPGEPNLMSLKLDVPTLRARGDQVNANIAYEYEDDPDLYNNYQGEVNGDTISAVSALTNRTDWSSWAFTYTDKIVGSVYNNLFDTPLQVKVKTYNNVKHAGLFEREYYYRLPYKPNTGGGTTLGAEASILTGRMFESRTYIAADTNNNSKVDWQDGALWVRDQLPKPLQGMQDIYAAGGAWQQVHGTFPDNPSNSHVVSPYSIFAPQMREIYYMTEGSPQEFAVAGWQQHGHDWRWGDWEQPVSPGAGGLQAMLQAKDDMSAYGGEVSYHLNQELTLDQANSWDPKVISRNSSGGLNTYSSVFGQHSFYNKSYFLDWAAGNTPARMNNFFTTQGMPAPKMLYNDQMWDNTSAYNGVYGVHESWAKANIFKTYANLGINIATEGYQPAHLRNGQFSNKYRNNANSRIDDFVAAGRTSYHIGSTNLAQLFSGLIANAGRSGNLYQTSNVFANAVIDDFYTYTYLNAFLQRQSAMEYIDNAQMTAVRWGSDIYAKLDKTQGNKFMVTQGNVVVADGNDRFIPDLKDPSQKIHVYSLGGSSKDWMLPASWSGVTKIDRYELTESGMSYVDRIDVTDGKVRLVTPARVPYILVPAVTQEIEAGAVNKAKGSIAAASSEWGTDTAVNAIDGNDATVWTANGGSDSWLEVNLGHETEVNRVEVSEQGQKILGYKLQYLQGDAWVDIKSGTTIGAKKQLLFPNIRSNKIRLYITNAMNQPQIKEFSIFSDANLSRTAAPSADSVTTDTLVLPDDRGVNVNYAVPENSQNANDGAAETFWKPNKTAGAWLQMDFSRVSRVNRAVIQELGNAVTGYKIQYLKGAQWIDLASGTSIGESLEVNFPTVETQKVRLLIVSATVLPKISEFNLFGVDNAIKIVNSNLALNKPATQSSTYSQSGAPQVASRAVDGNTNGNWTANSVSSTNDEQGAWWLVDLGGSYNVGNINIYNRTDCCGNRLSDYNVLLLDQNQNIIWSNHQTTQPNPSTTVNVGGAIGRYVKVQLTGKNSLALAEVEVFEPTGPDKSILQKLYDDSLTLVKEYYTDESWDNFAAALLLASQTLENADATEAQLSEANSNLYYARENLIEIPPDTTPPADASISADVIVPTNSDVIVSIMYPTDAAVKEYKLGDNGTWTAYGAPVVVSDNVIVYARAQDAAGNTSNVTSYTVGNIDHIAPADATLAVDTTVPTNQGVTVTIIYPADASVKEYKLGNNGAWTAYSEPVVVAENETVFARGSDAVGNLSNVTSITVSNIYKIAPITLATLSPGAPNGKNSWYLSDVTVNLSVTASVYGGEVTTEYQVNDGEWINYTGSIPTFSEGAYKLGYRSKDQAGNVEQLKTVEFKVDKTAPALEVQLDQTTIWPANHKMVKINASLNTSDAESGIDSVVLTSITSNQPDSGRGDIQADFGTAAQSFSLRAEKSRIYTITFTVTDKAGNKTVTTAIVTVPHDQSGK